MLLALCQSNPFYQRCHNCFSVRHSCVCTFLAFAELMVIMASVSASLSICNGKSSFKKGETHGKEGSIIQLLHSNV